MIRLVGNTIDYWISPAFTWSTGFSITVFNHNKGKYIKAGAVYYPDSGSFPRYTHTILPRDVSGTGTDYGVQMQGGAGNHTLNSVALGFYSPYPAAVQTECVAYLEFLEPTLPN